MQYVYSSPQILHLLPSHKARDIWAGSRYLSPDAAKAPMGLLALCEKKSGLGRYDKWLNDFRSVCQNNGDKDREK